MSSMLRSNVMRTSFRVPRVFADSRATRQLVKHADESTPSKLVKPGNLSVEAPIEAHDSLGNFGIVRSGHRDSIDFC